MIKAEEKNLSQSKEYLIKTCKISNSEFCRKYKGKTANDVELSLSDLKNTCHYDPDKPWWFWASIVGVGVLTGRLAQ
jgi:hypothetical protein